MNSGLSYNRLDLVTHYAKEASRTISPYAVKAKHFVFKANEVLGPIQRVVPAAYLCSSVVELGYQFVPLAATSILQGGIFGFAVAKLAHTIENTLFRLKPFANFFDRHPYIKFTAKYLIAAPLALGATIAISAGLAYFGIPLGGVSIAGALIMTGLVAFSEIIINVISAVRQFFAERKAKKEAAQKLIEDQVAQNKAQENLANQKSKIEDPTPPDLPSTT